MTKRKKIVVICAFLLISFIIPNKVKAKESASVKYQTHVQDIGWQTQVKDGEIDDGCAARGGAPVFARFGTG